MAEADGAFSCNSLEELIIKSATSPFHIGFEVKSPEYSSEKYDQYIVGSA